MGNLSTGHGGGIYNSDALAVVNNSIVYGNSAVTGANVYNSGGNPVFKYSLIEGSRNGNEWNSSIGTDGGNNLAADPAFSNIADSDFTLKHNSPAVNAGNNALIPAAITVDLAGNSRFYGTSVDIGAYEYLPKAPVLSGFADISKTYGEAAFTLTAPTSTSDGIFAFSSSDEHIATIQGNTVTIRGAGTTEITAKQAETAGYLSAEIKLTLTVNKATPIITNFTDITKTLSDTSFTLAPKSNSDGIFTYTSSDANVAIIEEDNMVKITGIGITEITAIQNSTSNYNAAEAKLILTVKKAIPELSVNDITKKYGDADFELPAPTSNSDGAFTYSSSNENVAAVSGNTVRIISAGTTQIKIIQEETDDFQQASITINLTVNKGEQLITPPSVYYKQLGSADFELDATIDTGLPLIYSSNNTAVAEVYQDALDGNKWKAKINALGGTKITIKQDGNENYNPISYSYFLDVDNGESRKLDMLFSTGQMEHSFPITTGKYHFIDVLPEIDTINLPGIYSIELEVTGTGYWPGQEGFVYGMAAYPIIDKTFHELGRYTEEWGYRGRNGNKYFEGRQLPFGGKAVRDIGDRIRLEYNTSTQKLFVYVKQVGEDEYTLSGEQAAFADVKATEGRKLRFVVAGICYQPNGIRIVSSSVPKKAQAITFTALANKTYGDADFSPGAVSDSGLPVSYSSDNANVVTIIDNKVHIAGAGTANITASQPGNETYLAATAKVQVITVDKKALTITADNKTMKQGQALPAFTASYNGFITGEDESVLTAMPDFNTTATTASAPGNYAIEVSGAEADNYSISYVNGILTIEEGTLPVNLLNFSASTEGNYAKLLWQTSSESNNKEYIISRSTNGVDFVEIAKIPGKENNHTASLYSHYDKEPDNGINYYKLSQVDYNGKVNELGIRTVSISLSAFGLQLYPNPTNDVVNVLFEAGKYNTLTVTDISGKVLQQVKISSDENSLTVSLGDYPAGTYLLRLSGSGGAETRKIVKK